MRSTSRTGLSLLELMVTVAILAVIIASIYEVLVISTQAVNTGTSKAKMEDDARRIIERIANECRAAILTTMDGDPDTAGIQSLASPSGSSSLTFQPSAGTNGSGGLVNGSARTIRWVVDPGEIAGDGIDNDFDGLIDEGTITFEDAGPPYTSTLGYNIALMSEGETANGADDNGDGFVDEKGLFFVLSGNQLTISVTVQAVNHNHELIQATIETTVKIMN